MIGRYNYGIFSEYLTILRYRLRFYSIIAHRLRLPRGEIDIIAKRGNNLVFIEVKGRKRGLSHEIISIKQQQRLKKSAEYFLARNSWYYGCQIRFDLAILTDYGWPHIIENAW